MPAASLSLQSVQNPASVIACVDWSAHAKNVALVAAKLAKTLDLPLTLFHVVEPAGERGRPDPLEWDLRRRQARRELSRLGDTIPGFANSLRLEVGEGEKVRAICERASAQGSLLVMGAMGPGQQPCHARTAEQVLEAGAGPVLLVPTGQPVPENPFERILVPLDGSSHAEAALAEASLLARRSGGELHLTHVVPEAGISLFGPPETADLDLRTQLDERNEMAACQFLERTRRRFADQGIKVSSKCLKGETRSRLRQAIAEERPGLVILSARGQGGRHCQDLSIGSTAAYLLSHLASPLMLVHPTAARAERLVQPVVEARRPAAFAA